MGETVCVLAQNYGFGGFSSYDIMKHVLSFFFLMIRPPPRSPLFPYTPLFRSRAAMIEAPHYSAVGASKKAVTLPEALFDGTVNEDVLHRAVITFLSNQRQGTSDTLTRSEEHTSELQSRLHLVCRLLLENKKRD